MRKLRKSYKTEIDPTPQQKIKINKTIGTCRFVYNFFLSHNKEIYETEKRYVSEGEFRKWMNNEFIPNNEEFKWIKEAYSKAVTQSVNSKTAKMKKLEKKLKREQRSLSRKYEDFKKRNKEKKGETTRQNIQKQVLKVQKIHKKMDDIRTDYINKTINEIVKTKPSYITIEDLNVTGMMKNRHLSKAVATQKNYEFRTKLEAKCKENGIELRIVDRWYPSSKMCNKCGNIKKDLKLSDRKYVCTCGHTADRDYNASLNLRDAKTYKVAQ